MDTRTCQKSIWIRANTWHCVLVSDQVNGEWVWECDALLYTSGNAWWNEDLVYANCKTPHYPSLSYLGLLTYFFCDKYRCSEHWTQIPGIFGVLGLHWWRLRPIIATKWAITAGTNALSAHAHVVTSAAKARFVVSSKARNRTMRRSRVNERQNWW